MNETHKGGRAFASGPSQGSRVAVVTALEEELKPFLKVIPGVREIPHAGPGRFYAGKLTFQDVVLGWTGDGRRAAREGLEVLLAEHQISHLLVLGIAGGLTDGLGLGQLVVAREVRDKGGLLAPPDPAWIDQATNLPGMREAIFYSNDRFVARAHDKDALGRRLLEESDSRVGAAVVDLETTTYVRTAIERGIPYTAVRAISDTVLETLPIDFSRLSDEDGHVRRDRVALHAVTHPWTVPALAVLRRRVRFCAQRLNDAAIFVILSQGSAARRSNLGPGPLDVA